MESAFHGVDSLMICEFERRTDRLAARHIPIHGLLVTGKRRSRGRIVALFMLHSV
jgi:hypothetical protein